jgi:hypothetical protein
MNTKQNTLLYVIAGFFVVFFSWMTHENAHFWVYNFLGYDAVMKLNMVYLTPGQTITASHAMIAAAAGPMVTMCQSIVTYLIFKFYDWVKLLYPLIFTAFCTRVMAGVMNYFNVNDEGLISTELGLGTYTISIIVSAFLLFLLYDISKKFKLSRKFQGLTLLIVTVSSAIIILSGHYLGITIFTSS